MFKGIMMLKTPLFFIVLIICQSISVSPCEGILLKKSIILDREAAKKPAWKKRAIFDYTYNPHVDLETWDKLKCYFLPSNHPLKANLDRIFQSARVTKDRESFIAAGFSAEGLRSARHVIVGKHSLLKGYIVKAYLDTQTASEWENFLKRLMGAKAIKACIKRHGYQKRFVVPKKWIYPLPADPSPPDDPQYYRKNFILIVEDMYIVSHRENTKLFTTKITPKILDALYTIVTEEELTDCVIRRNIPFNRGGKISFIDTEHHHLGPVNYACLTQFLSPEMRLYWQGLIDQGGPTNKSKQRP